MDRTVYSIDRKSWGAEGGEGSAKDLGSGIKLGSP